MRNDITLILSLEEALAIESIIDNISTYVDGEFRPRPPEVNDILKSLEDSIDELWTDDMTGYDVEEFTIVLPQLFKDEPSA